MEMDLACGTFIEQYLPTLDSPFLRYFTITEDRNQGRNDFRSHCIQHSVTQDISTSQIWDSYVK